MLYNTYINNIKALEWKLNANQAALFDLLNQLSSWAEAVTINGDTFYFVSREKIISELPLFYSKADTVYRHFKEFAIKGLIVYLKLNGKNLVKLTQKGKEWNFRHSKIDPNAGEQFEKIRIQIQKNSDSNPNISYNNNISNNHTKNNAIISQEEDIKQESVICNDIINYLNEKLGKSYKHQTEKTKSLIKDRLGEKFTIDDFKRVIDTKNDEWTGTEFEKFLRPETLFGNKFESYLNQKPLNEIDKAIKAKKISKTTGTYMRLAQELMKEYDEFGNPREAQYEI
jgi:uncharacterized phage protein (TIGR02220 family)